METTLSFKDAIGNDLKVGDYVLKAIGSKLVERRITQMTLRTDWRGQSYFRVQLSATPSSGSNYYRFTQALGPKRGNELLKKPA